MTKIIYLFLLTIILPKTCFAAGGELAVPEADPTDPFYTYIKGHPVGEGRFAELLTLTDDLRRGVPYSVTDEETFKTESGYGTIPVEEQEGALEQAERIGHLVKEENDAIVTESVLLTDLILEEEGTYEAIVVPFMGRHGPSFDAFEGQPALEDGPMARKWQTLIAIFLLSHSMEDRYSATASLVEGIYAESEEETLKRPKLTKHKYSFSALSDALYQNQNTADEFQDLRDRGFVY